MKYKIALIFSVFFLIHKLFSAEFEWTLTGKDEYPFFEEYEKGKEISIENTDEKTTIFHAGTIIKNNKVVSNGGRVIAITSYGKNLETALKTNYKNIEKVTFDGAYYRKDIGKDVL